MFNCLYEFTIGRELTLVIINVVSSLEDKEVPRPQQPFSLGERCAKVRSNEYVGEFRRFPPFPPSASRTQLEVVFEWTMCTEIEMYSIP